MSTVEQRLAAIEDGLKSIGRELKDIKESLVVNEKPDLKHEAEIQNLMAQRVKLELECEQIKLEISHAPYNLFFKALISLAAAATVVYTIMRLSGTLPVEIESISIEPSEEVLKRE